MFESYKSLTVYTIQQSLRRPATNTDASGENSGIRDQLLNDAKRLREEKDTAIGKRKTMDQELRTLNDKISRMVRPEVVYET